MATGLKSKETNILWLSDNVDSLEGLQAVYSRFFSLQNNPKVPWILLNVCCDGSQDSRYSAAILTLLLSSTKPFKTQVMTSAVSYGLIFACVGAERVSWPDAEFMHHSFQLETPTMSLEDLDAILRRTKKSEKKSLDFMKKQMGDVSFRNFINDFKKNGSKDMDFDATKALEYNIVHEIGIIQPLFI